MRSINGPAIRKWRQSNRWTLKQAAAVLGVSYITLHRWEVGKCRPQPVMRLLIRRTMESEKPKSS